MCTTIKLLPIKCLWASTDVNETIVQEAALAKWLQAKLCHQCHTVFLIFQIPRYIITLHELLAHTPHEHVERKSLEFAKSKLEELSK